MIRVLPLIVLFALSSPSLIAQSSPYTSRSSRMTMIAPTTAMSSMGMQGRRFVAHLSLERSPSGAVTVSGHPEWATSGLPISDEVRFVRRRVDRSSGIQTLDFQSNSRIYRVTFSTAISPDEALMEFIVPHAPPSSETVRIVAQRISAIASESFSGPASDLSMPDRMAILSSLLGNEYSASVGVVSYRDGSYFSIDMGTSWNTINSAVTTHEQRHLGFVRAVAVGSLRSMSVYVKRASRLAGISIQRTIQVENFVTGQKSDSETIRIYAPSDAILEFERDDITNEQFIDRCFVLLDGSRIDVDLAVQ